MDWPATEIVSALSSFFEAFLHYESENASANLTLSICVVGQLNKLTSRNIRINPPPVAVRLTVLMFGKTHAINIRRHLLDNSIVSCRRKRSRSSVSELQLSFDIVP